VAVAKRKGMKIHAVLNADNIGYSAGIESFTWAAIEKGDGLREKASVVKKMVTTWFLRISRGDMAVEVVGREQNRELVRTVSAVLRSGNSSIHVKDVVSNDCGGGDEGPFWNEGYDAVYLTSAYRNPWRHSAHDTTANINLKQIEAISSGLCSAVMLLGNR
jgi:hypothetical protein